MSKESKHRLKRKSSKILDDTKLHEIHRLFRDAVKKKEIHRMRDFEEIRIVDRFDRRRYLNSRKMKMCSKADSARAKWKGLRDTFRGELKKVNKTIASGTHVRSTNWEYFDEMLFVKDQIYSNRRSLAYILQAQQRAVPAADSSVEESNASVDLPMLYKQEVIEENEDTQDAIEDDPTVVVDKVEPQPSLPPSQVHSTDDDYNFLMSILPQLRNLPTMRNLYVRLKIQELLYNEIVSLQDNN
ncbi:uncharacterized protein [Halyomorpha halys]|uniref:uncharacterized protein isoform X2 n=1 Tax=Halyomorpha halys TaxID=286706 RepID=UPI000D0C7B2A|nr:uncharacterized protein LOC106682977 isoform X2 [Halyomorpha halys]